MFKIYAIFVAVANTMKVTLITVTLNSEKFLEESILSVIAQDYKDIEHIIIDGESTDGTLAIIEKYNNHIATWVSEKDYSMYDAINKGMRMATGDIIGTLNSDDTLASPDVISKIVESFESKKVDAVYGDLLYENLSAVNFALDGCRHILLFISGVVCWKVAAITKRIFLRLLITNL
jgi:glycosyltransferase involved in cell wall biosynthesis